MRNKQTVKVQEFNKVAALQREMGGLKQDLEDCKAIEKEQREILAKKIAQLSDLEQLLLQEYNYHVLRAQALQTVLRAHGVTTMLRVG